jgi:putative YhbY family RNA-binding protein
MSSDSAPRRPVTARAFRPLLAALLGACAPALRPLPPVASLPAPVEREAPPTRPTAPAAPNAAATVSAADLAYLGARALMVPVAGVRPDRVPDTFNSARSGGRVHRAVDILAPRGTPVLAADSGRVYRMRANALGGITIYATDPGERFVYYYAHLDHYRDGLAEGVPVAKGEVLGYVGTTGNAPPDTPHLHFQVMRIREARRWWDGIPVDPRPYFAFSGTESMALTGKERAELRSEAHHLTPLVHVGHQGITPNVVQALDDALRTRELVKVQLTRTVDASAKDAAQELATATKSEVVQTIGKTATLYRENPELPKKKGDLPPWKR